MKHRNKIFLILLITLLANLSFNCSIPKKVTEPFNPIIDESIFVSGSIDYYESGHVRNGILNDHHIIDNVHYLDNTSIFFYENGQVEQGYLYDTNAISNVFYMSDITYASNIYFYASGQVSNGLLSSDYIIDGNTYHSGNRITFNRNGTLNLISRFVEGSVSHYDGGQINNGILNGNYGFNGVSYSSNTRIFFYENGQVEQGYLYDTDAISNVFYTTNITYASNIYFYASGQVSNGRLSSDYIIDGNTYYSGNRITFNRNGTLNLISRFVEGSVSYYNGGQINNGILNGNYGFNGVSLIYSSNTRIFFYENGQVRRGRLNGNNTISNVSYRDNYDIYLELAYLISCSVRQSPIFFCINHHCDD